jgi:hypothetical protein
VLRDGTDRQTLLLLYRKSLPTQPDERVPNLCACCCCPFVGEPIRRRVNGIMDTQQGGGIAASVNMWALLADNDPGDNQDGAVDTGAGDNGGGDRRR